jgi:hypothetical protein
MTLSSDALADAIRQVVTDAEPGTAVEALVAAAGRLHAAQNGLPVDTTYTLFRNGTTYSELFTLDGRKTAVLDVTAFRGNTRILQVLSDGAREI